MKAGIFGEWLSREADCLPTEEMDSFLRFAAKRGVPESTATELFHQACSDQADALKWLLNA